MTLYVKLKTTRNKNGYANATLHRYKLPFIDEQRYRFHFYNDNKSFSHHKELRAYILEKYDCDIGERKDFWGF